MNVLGISCYYHDAAACLVKDGVVVAAAEEERFTRRKHDADFPRQAIRYCLEAAGLQVRQLDVVGFYEKPLLKLERILATAVTHFPRGGQVFSLAMQQWLRTKLWITSAIRSELGYRGPIRFVEHHLSHAASSFLVSPFEEAAVLTVDGVGEWTTTAWGTGRGAEVDLTEEIRFPHSLGLFYSTFTAHLGFEVNDGEYKLMGMAAYGEPRYYDQVRHLIRLADDGSFELDLDYFAFPHSMRAASPRLHELFGPPRRPDDESLDQRHADIAASVQLVLEEAVLGLCRHARRRTGSTNLAMAGGVALNVLANRRILRESGFEQLFIQPAAGDAGGALGVAAYLHATALRLGRPAPMTHAFLGPSFGPDEVSAFLREHGISHERLEPDALVGRVADRLAAGEVVGWFQGRMEWGPRALGNRSILASPASAEMKETLNRKIKHREPFRPFAPAVLLEEADRYFDPSTPSPFMLLVAGVRPERRGDIPAVTHVDGTARLQTVTREDNGRYYELLRAFRDRTGLGVLVNTSFNVRGEPIVCTPQHAYNCFAHTDIDALALGDCLIQREAKRKIWAYPGMAWVSERVDMVS